jgi:hypothetical protein
MAPGDRHGGPVSAGTIWFIGWLFTLAFAQLIWWKAILALVVWPYYLGVALR